MSQPRLVAEVMNRHVLTVMGEMTLGDLAEFLIGHGISGAPVVDADKRLLGVVSMTDITRDLAVSSMSERASVSCGRPDDTASLTVQVRDVMTPVANVLEEQATVVEAARLMAGHHIHRLLVTSGPDRELVGIVTSMDLLRLVAEA